MTHLNNHTVDQHERAMVEYEEVCTGRVTALVALLSFVFAVTGVAVALVVLA
jgi:hypothetical protein